MGLNCGIVGLPNAGKSTLFQALTAIPTESANYPFCTIEPNVGIAMVEDERLPRIAEIISSQKAIAATIEFIDIAGLVKGASQGAGLGNRFLAKIRETDAIAHVVRCFPLEGDGENGSEADSGELDPRRDLETVRLELILADLQTIERRIETLRAETRGAGRAITPDKRLMLELMPRLREALSQETLARDVEISSDERVAIRDLHLLTMKPELAVCNVDERDAARGGNDYSATIASIVGEDRAITLCAKLEAEISQLDSAQERQAFLSDANIAQPGAARLARKAYQALGLGTFFTAGPNETRAWSFRIGETAREIAGRIHSDFAKGFICAETYHYDDLIRHGAEVTARSKGIVRKEGAKYLARDGDIIHFRHNS